MTKGGASEKYAWAGLFGLLFLSLLLSLYLSSLKVFWVDELYEFYSDARPTLWAVIRGQQHFPFSLEPPAFHLLLHVFQRIPLRAEMSTRLPSALALIATQFAAFSVVRSLTGRPAPALLAAMLPMALATFDYSAEARVYSLLTASYAVAFLCYARALRSTGRQRTLAQAGLFLSLSGCILLHYFGLFLPIPFVLAEATGFFRERARDWRTALAIVGSFAAFLLNVPFLAGVREIQTMYNDSGEARWDMAPLTYAWLLLRGRIYHLRQQGNWKVELISGAVICLLLAMLFLLWWRMPRAQDRAATRKVLLALAIGLFVPVANLVVGIYHSHAYSPRYSLPVAFPVVVLSAYLLAPVMRSTMIAAGLLGCAALVTIAEDRSEMRLTRLQSQAFRAMLQPSPALERATAASTDQHLYFQELTDLLPIYFYAPAPLRDRLVQVWSIPLEYQWQHSATASQFSRNMQASTQLPIVPYAVLRQRSGTHLVVAPHAGGGWLLEELSAEHLPMREMGVTFDSELVLVRWP